MNLGFAFEPTAWIGLIRAFLVVGSAWGFSLSKEQTLALYGFVEAVSSFLNRSLVTPANTSSVTVTRTEPDEALRFVASPKMKAKRKAKR